MKSWYTRVRVEEREEGLERVGVRKSRRESDRNTSDGDDYYCWKEKLNAPLIDPKLNGGVKGPS